MSKYEIGELVIILDKLVPSYGIIIDIKLEHRLQKSKWLKYKDIPIYVVFVNNRIIELLDGHDLKMSSSLMSKTNKEGIK